MSYSYPTYNGRYSDPTTASVGVGATGATTLVAAPAAGNQIAVDWLRVDLRTDTTAFIESFFTWSDAAAPYFRTRATQTGTTTPLFIQFQDPWILPSATSLGFNFSVTAASTGAATVTVGYRLLTR